MTGPLLSSAWEEHSMRVTKAASARIFPKLRLPWRVIEFGQSQRLRPTCAGGNIAAASPAVAHNS